jgi:hypothetical protein
MLAFVDLESRLPLDHPLRTVKRFADEALAALSPLFETMYADSGRPSIPPERLLKASLLMWFCLLLVFLQERSVTEPRRVPSLAPRACWRALAGTVHRHR